MEENLRRLRILSWNGFLHLYAAESRRAAAPFHNMALMSPATAEADVDLHTRFSLKQRPN